MTTQEVPTFRYNFSKKMIAELGYFAKLHKHEDRYDFKDSWDMWLEENKELIIEENKMLKKMGYNGDIEDKMFKSVRYYFRKKTPNSEPTTRCVRTAVSKELLDLMDEHITKNHFNNNYTPQIAYDEFYKLNVDAINDEINELNLECNETTYNKIKKTYKNRFYLIVRQNKKNKDTIQEDANVQTNNIEQTNNKIQKIKIMKIKIIKINEKIQFDEEE